MPYRAETSSIRALAHALVLGLASAQAAAQYSPAWNSFAANPDAHPTIPNIAYAGYESGTVALPDSTDGRLVVNVSSYGAEAGDAVDDTVAVRAAIDIAVGLAESNPAGTAVVFEAGEYILSGPLFIGGSGVILEGAGVSQTSLRFTTSLQVSHAVYSHWGFSGGMIWFIDDSRETYRTGVPTITSLNTGWKTTGSSRDLTMGASLGDRSVVVSNASSFQPGDYVYLQIDNADDLSTLRHLFGDGIWANGYPFNVTNDGAIMPDQRSIFRMIHRVESVSGNTVTFEEPLKSDARLEWNPTLRTPSQVIENVGVRDMTVRFDRNYTWTDADHNNEPGYNGVCMNAVFNGFVENVAFRNSDGAAVNINGGKHITVRNVDIGADTDALRTMHHAFVISNAYDTLIEDFLVSSKPRHGLSYGASTMGCVYSRGLVVNGTFDYHRLLPYANAMTEISIVNSGRAGGDSDSGPAMGARHAHWNVNTLGTGGRFVAQADIMPNGSLVGVHCVALASGVNPIAGDAEALVQLSGMDGLTPVPPNLYEAQLALRLGLPIIDDNEIETCDTCGPDDVYTFPADLDQGQDLAGQDGWEMLRDFSNSGPVAMVGTDASYPDGPIVVPIGVHGRDGIYSRQNNLDFGYTAIAGDATAATVSFDLRAGGTSGSGDAILILNNAYDEGFQFGIVNNNSVYLRGGLFSQTLLESVSIPSGWYSRGEWARLRLTMDLTANGGDGAATIAFLNLTRGETVFRDVPGMINVSLQGEPVYPETWDRVQVRLDDEAVFTNIAINVDVSDDTPCCDIDLAEPFGVVDYLDAVAFYQAYDVDDPIADWDGNGMIEEIDILAYEAAHSAGCP